MKFRARAESGKIEFETEKAKQMFMAVTADITIEIDDKPSANARRFFEGAVVPAVYYQNPHAGWSTFADAREAVKLEFLGRYTHSISGGKVRYSRSTAELTKERFREFLDKVLRWMEEQGMETPDSVDYLRWRNSAPGRNEEYPPLLRLKTKYLADTHRV